MRALFHAALPGLALVLAASTAYAQQTLPEEFFGQFRGKLAVGDGTAEGDFTVVIRRTGGGFAVSWPPRISETFEPAGRPNVFKSVTDGRILEGDPFYWARLDGNALIIYEALIGEHGGYRIDNYTYTVAAGDLDLVVRQVVSGAEPRASKGRLERYGQ